MKGRARGKVIGRVREKMREKGERRVYGIVSGSEVHIMHLDIKMYEYE